MLLLNAVFSIKFWNYILWTSNTYIYTAFYYRNTSLYQELIIVEAVYPTLNIPVLKECVEQPRMSLYFFVFSQYVNVKIYIFSWLHGSDIYFIDTIQAILLWYMSTPVRISNSLLSCDERSERPSREEWREELLACPWRLPGALLSTNIFDMSVEASQWMPVVMWRKKYLSKNRVCLQLKRVCVVEEPKFIQNCSSPVDTHSTTANTGRYWLWPSKTCTDIKTQYRFCVSITFGSLLRLFYSLILLTHLAKKPFILRAHFTYTYWVLDTLPPHYY